MPPPGAHVDRIVRFDMIDANPFGYILIKWKVRITNSGTAHFVMFTEWEIQLLMGEEPYPEPCLRPYAVGIDSSTLWTQKAKVVKKENKRVCEPWCWSEWRAGCNCNLCDLCVAAVRRICQETRMSLILFESKFSGNSVSWLSRPQRLHHKFTCLSKLVSWPSLGLRTNQQKL